MINGDVREFIDGLYYGYKRFFMYHGKKYFIQGYGENDKPMLVLYVIENPNDNFTWKAYSDNNEYPVDNFLNDKIFDSKTFWEAEKDMEWVD